MGFKIFNKKTILFFSLLLSALVFSQSEGNMLNTYAISLEGNWQFKLDPENVGVKEQWFLNDLGSEKILLPGTTDERKIGRPESKQSGRFTRTHAYRGAAWYQLEFDVPEDFKEKQLFFFMERTKVSKVWFDGKWVGEDNSLITTQEFYLGENITPGKHILTVRIHNGKEENPPIGNNHQVSDGTQTNWNGILGDILLTAKDAVWIKNVKVYPDIDKNLAKVEVFLDKREDKPVSGSISLAAKSWNSNAEHQVKPVKFRIKKYTGDVVSIELPMGDAVQLWSEFNPALYRLSVHFSGKSGGQSVADSAQVDFGMRKFHTIGTSFAINGKKTFLRGKHDGAVFPDKGYPPMDVASWIELLKNIKSYGINHIRCHTWCPPAAAFQACDILGMYMLPELPHWGPVGNQVTKEEGDVEQKLEVYDNTTQYLVKEGYRLLDEYGNHASFVMFEIGNELSGNREEIANITEKLRTYDNRHLFAGGANIFLWNPKQMPTDDFWTTTMTGGSYGTGVYHDTEGLEARSSYPNHNEGHVNNILKGTDYDYSSAIKHVTVPVISHENGQYQMYPNFKEISKFDGVTRPYNFEMYRERLEEAGMGDLANDFFEASGALAVLCYREDLESAIRTPNFGGFQMLDLQDFPGQGTALVGILDAHLESKGLITPEKWREFCNEVVPLLRHEQFTWTNNETFSTRAQIANYGASDINHRAVWRITNKKGTLLAEGQLPLKTIQQGGITDLGTITFNLNKITTAQDLEVTLSIPDTPYTNSYQIWVYPEQVDVELPSNVFMYNAFNEEAKRKLAEGRNVLILPTKDVLPTSIDGAFQTDFWCYSMFSKYDPPGTLGILTNPEHPALAKFPTEFHSNWQWWRLLKHGRPINLNSLPKDYRPLVQVIDNVTLNRRLGVLFEAQVGKGQLMVCSMDLQNQQDHPEGRQMLYSVLQYMKSDAFKPSYQLTENQIESIILGDD